MDLGAALTYRMEVARRVSRMLRRTLAPRIGAGCVCVVLAALQSLSLVAEETPSPEAIYQAILPTVMTLEVEQRNGERTVGSAFVALREGRAITAWHLLRDAKVVTARFSDGEQRAITGVLDWDEIKDVAVVSVETGARPPGRLCLTNPPVGARAYAVGAPQGYSFTFTDGLISQVQMIDGFAQYQTSCPISPGSSGGPLLNAQGEVLGVICWSRDGAQNVNFATPASCLAGLNCDASATTWSDLPRVRRAREKSAAALQRGTRREAAAHGVSQERELRTALQRVAGRKVEVTIRDGNQERCFTVTLPEGFVR